MTKKDKNVFVSHAKEDGDSLVKLKDLLEKKGYNIYEYSAPMDNPSNDFDDKIIKNKILKPKLDASCVLVVIISDNTKDNKWVDWEIGYAVQQDKLVVGIWAQKNPEFEVPESLDDYIDVFVSWDGDKIVRALEGEKFQEDCAGKPRSPRKLKPAKC